MRHVKTCFFEPVTLEQMDKVKLMNRMDTKYWFHIDYLQYLLECVKDDYLILNIDGLTQMPYSTIYYDTINRNMYQTHHNGKLNRFKIRKRTYKASGINFLEVKFKNNKGRTIKKRILSIASNPTFTIKESEFIQNTTPFSASELVPALNNDFNRITLVSKNFKERCTVDFNLQFTNKNKTTGLDQLIIFEIKSEGVPSSSPLANALRNQRIKSSGFSKYCIGQTVTDSTLKRNAFKHKIRMIDKTLNMNNSLYKI